MSLFVHRGKSRNEYYDGRAVSGGIKAWAPMGTMCNALYIAHQQSNVRNDRRDHQVPRGLA